MKKGQKLKPLTIPIVEELRKSDRIRKQATPRSNMGEYIGPGQKGGRIP